MHHLTCIRPLIVLGLTVFASEAKAQSDSTIQPPEILIVKEEKPANFKSIELGYSLVGQPEKRSGLILDLEIMSYVPTQRMRIGLEHHGQSSTMAFIDYAWYARSPIIRKTFNGYFEIGLGVGAFGHVGYSEKRTAVELRSGYGYRTRLSDRVNLKLALRGRLGYRKPYDDYDYGLYPEIGLDLACGYDLF
jgi:hypothetical protein